MGFVRDVLIILNHCVELEIRGTLLRDKSLMRWHNSPSFFTLAVRQVKAQQRFDVA
jgi:hypothetical protein